MFGKLAWLLSLMGLVGIAAFTVGCGGSSPCTGTFPVVGNWKLTVTDNGGGGTATNYGAIDSGGLALFFDNTGDTVELPTLTGACSFTGSINAYAEPGSVPGGSLITDASQGNVNSSTSITGSFTGTGSNPSGTFTAISFPPLTGAVSAINGQMTGQVQGPLNGQPVLLPLTFTPSGSNASMSFANTVFDPNCAVSGTFTQVATDNVFDVSITFTGTTCAISGTFSGLGFESSTDYFGFNGSAAETYLYADILASTNTFVMEIF